MKSSPNAVDGRNNQSHSPREERRWSSEVGPVVLVAQTLGPLQSLRVLSIEEQKLTVV